jgi:cyclohexa-1,5-dienecarbonyl-CoA hydratase
VSEAAVVVESLEDGAVLRIVMDRPKGNVLTGSVMLAIDGALREHAGDPALRLVTIEGAGGHFSYGASVEEHRREQVAQMLGTVHALIRRVGHYPVPVAALVRGRCLGGAFELALACHFVFATRDAVFACPEITLGVFPPALAALGGARLGGAWTERLLLTGGELDAESARALGLVTALVPEGEDLGAWALQWYAKTLKPLSAFALRQAVRAVRAGNGVDAALGEPLDAAEKRYLDELPPSHDGNEGIEAFLAGRPPKWKNA